jgi:hypothetical protein
VLTGSRVVSEIARQFEVMAPFVEFLNRPFAERRPKAKKMLFSMF